VSQIDQKVCLNDVKGENYDVILNNFKGSQEQQQQDVTVEIPGAKRLRSREQKDVTTKRGEQDSLQDSLQDGNVRTSRKQNNVN